MVTPRPHRQAFWWGTCVIVLATWSAAAADPPSATFISAGVSIGFGTRGFTLGIEASTGYYSNQTGGYGGGAGGFEYAFSPDADEPWGRIYAEAEAGWVAFGAGVGPALLFGSRTPARLGFQATPYVAVGVFGCQNREPFTVVAPFYRYTRTGQNLHDGGLFAKQLWFVNGKQDNGVCTH